MEIYHAQSIIACKTIGQGKSRFLFGEHLKLTDMVERSKQSTPYLPLPQQLPRPRQAGMEHLDCRLRLQIHQEDCVRGVRPFTSDISLLDKDSERPRMLEDLQFQHRQRYRGGATVPLSLCKLRSKGHHFQVRGHHRRY